MKKAVSDIVSALKKYQPEKIILFGSQARGEEDRFSDFDILILKETEKRFLERLREIALLLGETPLSVNAFIYTQKEFAEMRGKKNPFIKKVLKEGRILYETKNY